MKWGYQNKKIHDNVDSVCANEQSSVWHTCSTFSSRTPGYPDRSALENKEELCDNSPDTDKNNLQVANIAQLLVNTKDANIKRKHAQLD